MHNETKIQTEPVCKCKKNLEYFFLAMEFLVNIPI